MEGETEKEGGREGDREPTKLASQIRKLGKAFNRNVTEGTGRIHACDHVLLAACQWMQV